MASRILLIDGLHNHQIWPSTTECFRRFLDETQLFDVTVLKAQIAAKDFTANFDGYDAVVLNYNPNPGADVGDIWPETTRRAFEDYMRNGGGLVVIHAANNSFAHWPEFNQMTGIGGWGGRNRNWGPYVYYDQQGNLQIDNNDPDNRVGTDGPPHEYVVDIRDANHPITNGLPARWKHCMDEIYERLRGPAHNLNVLATAFSENIGWHQQATYRHEPLVMNLDYGQGRVFHLVMGHWTYSIQCVGFITLLQRGTEWAATSTVTQAVPSDFPTVNDIKYRKLVWDDFAVAEWTPYT